MYEAERVRWGVYEAERVSGAIFFFKSNYIFQNGYFRFSNVFQKFPFFHNFSKPFPFFSIFTSKFPFFRF